MLVHYSCTPELLVPGIATEACTWRSSSMRQLDDASHSKVAGAQQS